MIKTKAFAKLNLNLHVFPKKPKDQFSQIKFINCQLNFFDELVFENQPNDISIVWSDNNSVPDENNLIFKVAHLLKEISNNRRNGVQIKIKKNIPITGGLGGGSTDAAATFLALNKLWHLNFNLEQLNKLAVNLGTDICYLLHGGLCEVNGIGEQIKKLDLKLPKFYLVLIYPEAQKPSTGEMYKSLNPKLIGQNLEKLDQLKSTVKEYNLLLNDKSKNLVAQKFKILNYLFNDFESTAEKLFSEVQKIKTDLLTSGAQKTLLLGSGLGVTGFFLNQKSAQLAFDKLSQKYQKIFLTNTI